MKQTLLIVFLLLNTFFAFAQKTKHPVQTAPAIYYPDKNWQKKKPGEVGMDSVLLKTAIDFAITNETTAPRDLKLNHYRTFGREPFGDAVGPLQERGDQSGIIIKNGYVIAEWGDPYRIDIVNSVSKSMLSSIVGVAFDRGLIPDIDDQVYKYVPPVQLYNPNPSGNKADDFTKNQISSNPSIRRIIKPLPGAICCSKTAIGKEHFGANRIGPTDRTRITKCG